MLNVFVAHPYSPPPFEGYRDVYRRIERTHPHVKFLFADEHINSDVILARVMAAIDQASLCVCDITRWNPNVTMELGLALGMRKRVQLLFFEERRLFGRGQLSSLDLPADIRGHSRINYRDGASLQAGLRALIQQEFANPDPNTAAGSFKAICESVYGLLGREPGLKSFEVARHLGMETANIRPAIDHLLREDRIYQEGRYMNAQFYQKGYVRPAPLISSATDEPSAANANVHVVEADKPEHQ